MSIAWGVSKVLWSDARTFTTTCSGANVTGTIWVDDARVFASVAVVPKERRWDIKWGAYADEVSGSAMTSSSNADFDGSLLNATQLLGDLDGGTHRTAEVRPDGQSDWCALDMRVSLLW